MMSDFTEHHQKGVDAFTKSLEHKRQTCHGCGFEDTVLDSEWQTHVETEPRSGHILYRLTCPNCTETETVEIDI
ncbi:hypothetical protein JCM9743_16010 [Natrinema sp. JCM 9743]